MKGKVITQKEAVCRYPYYCLYIDAIVWFIHHNQERWHVMTVFSAQLIQWAQ